MAARSLVVGPLTSNPSEPLIALWKLVLAEKDHRALIKLRAELQRLIAATSRRSQELRYEQEGVGRITDQMRRWAKGSPYKPRENRLT